MNYIERNLSRLIAEGDRLPLLSDTLPPQLESGAPAPLFDAQSWTGDSVNLEKCRGTKTWVAFFRHASCPMCLLRVNEMIRRYPAWAAPDFRIIGIFHSSPERIAHNVGRQAPPFHLVSDPGLELYRLYSLRRAQRISLAYPRTFMRLAAGIFKGYTSFLARGDEPWDTVPGDFLIDADGQLSDVFYGRGMGEHIPFERVERWLGFNLPQPDGSSSAESPERSYRELFGGE